MTPGDPTPRQACPPEPRGPEAYPCLPPSSPHQGEHLSPRLRSLGELTPARGGPTRGPTSAKWSCGSARQEGKLFLQDAEVNFREFDIKKRNRKTT